MTERPELEIPSFPLFSSQIKTFMRVGDKLRISFRPHDAYQTGLNRVHKPKVAIALKAQADIFQMHDVSHKKQQGGGH